MNQVEPMLSLFRAARLNYSDVSNRLMDNSSYGPAHNSRRSEETHIGPGDSSADGDLRGGMFVQRPRSSRVFASV